jgi:hypothetical protein
MHELIPLLTRFALQEARGEGDGEGDPQHGAPATAGGHQALQPRPPRLPPSSHLRRRHCEIELAPLFELSMFVM